jgi:hypothetical protein
MGDKNYAVVKGPQEFCCDGRKKRAKKLSHRLLRHYEKNALRKSARIIEGEVI